MRIIAWIIRLNAIFGLYNDAISSDGNEKFNNNMAKIVGSNMSLKVEFMRHPCECGMILYPEPRNYFY